MGDMGELFNAARAAGKERRESNRKTTPELLLEHGVAFESKNEGAHLVIRHAGKVADLWPGTGKYLVRRPGGKGERYCRGVFNLLRDLGASKPAADAQQGLDLPRIAHFLQQVRDRAAHANQGSDLPDNMVAPWVLQNRQDIREVDALLESIAQELAHGDG